MMLSQSGKQPYYILFAGVNGAGKTALYDVLNKTVPLGARVCIDDIARSLGNWREPMVQIKAARRAMSLIDSHISDKVSFHQETTLPGDSVRRRIECARERGFSVVLYYVGIDSLSIAIERVHRRIEAGGHGVDDRVIAKRYRELSGNLRRIMRLCDKIYFYDNTLRFKQVAVFSKGKFEDIDNNLPLWFGELLSNSSEIAGSADVITSI